MNRMKTLMLLATLTALLLLAGHAMAGQGGMLTALVLAGLMNFGAYWWSDKIVLRVYGARKVTEAEAPALHGLVRNLVRRAGLPMPKVYVIPQGAPNAFATGRNPDHAALAVTEGLMALLDREELTAEMSDQLLLWGGFAVGVLVLLALDLGVSHRRAHAVKLKEALAWSAVWIALALILSLGIYVWRGP